MRSRLTVPGTALAALTATLGLWGAILSHLSMLIAASIILAGLGAAWVLTRHRIRTVHSGALDMVWWVDLPHGTHGTIVPGRKLSLHVTMRNRARVSLGSCRLEFVTGPGLSISPVALPLPPEQTTSVQGVLHPHAVGRWLVHGALVAFQGPAGIFSWDAYFPAPQALRILPEAVVRRRRLMPRGMEQDTKGRFRVVGPGGDLREVREYRPGDPFKLMAWKHTARRGKPMVRQLEHPTRGRLHIILDMSPSMRDAPVGSSKLDCAIQSVADQAASAASAGAPFSYQAVDMDIYHELEQDEGPRQLSRLLLLLSDLHTVVEEGFTDSTDQEVVEAIGRYLAYQEGMDTRAAPDDPRGMAGTENFYLKPLLVKWARSCLESRKHPQRDRMPKVSVPVARDPTMAMLRTCCRIRGITLPYRSGGLPENKTKGLAAALTKIAVTRSPMTLILVTDLRQLSVTGSLEDALRLTRRRGHSLQLLVPYAPNLKDRPNDPVAGAIFDLQGRREWLSIQENVIAFSRMGFDVRFLDRTGRPIRRTRQRPEPILARNAASL